MRGDEDLKEANKTGKVPNQKGPLGSYRHDQGGRSRYEVLTSRTCTSIPKHETSSLDASWNREGRSGFATVVEGSL